MGDQPENTTGDESALPPAPALTVAEQQVPRHVVPPLELPEDVSERTAKLARILHNLEPGTYDIHLVKPPRNNSAWRVTVVTQETRQYDIT